MNLDTDELRALAAKVAPDYGEVDELSAIDLSVEAVRAAEEIDRLRAANASRIETDVLRETVARVRELHHPHRVAGGPCCAGCGHPWPCRTAVALNPWWAAADGPHHCSTCAPQDYPPKPQGHALCARCGWLIYVGDQDPSNPDLDVCDVCARHLQDELSASEAEGLA